MLLECGNTTVGNNWQLDEQRDVGFCRVYYIHEADILYKDSFEEISFAPGNLYILPSALPYSARRVSDKPFVCTFMHIAMFPVSTNRIICIPVKEGTMLFYLLRTIMSAIDDGRKDRVAKLTEIISEIIKEHPSCHLPSPELCDILEYIYKNPGSDLSNEHLSEMMHFSTHYFIRMFRKEVGCAPQQYVKSIRMRHAERLLSDDIPVNGVAQMLGYSDGNGLSKAYKAYWGVRPTRHNKKKALP